MQYFENKIRLLLQDIIAETVIPMNIFSAVYRQLLIIRKHFAPAFVIAVKRPAVCIKTPPQNCFSIFINILLCYHTCIIRLYIHQAHCIKFHINTTFLFLKALSYFKTEKYNKRFIIQQKKSNFLIALKIVLFICK